TFAKELNLPPNDLEARATIYRTLCFTCQIANLICPTKDLYIEFGDYMQDLLTCSDTASALQQDSQAYLAERPNVDAFLGYYAQELDASNQARWLHVVDIVGGVMFKLAEQGLASQKIKAEIDQFFNQSA